MGNVNRFGIATCLAVLTATLSQTAAGAMPVRTPFARPAQAPIADLLHHSDVRDLGRAPDATLVTVAVTLNYQRQAELGRLVAMQTDRRSPFYRRFLSNAQFNAYFAPSQADYARAIAALQHAGFRITHTFANRTMIDAAAPVRVAERYFVTEIHRVVQVNAGVRYANARPATVPAELNGIVGTVSGLNNLIVAHPTFQLATPAQKAALARVVAVENARIAALRNSPRSTRHRNCTTNDYANPLNSGCGSGSTNTNGTGPGYPTATPSPTPAPTAAPTATPTPTPTPTPIPTGHPIAGSVRGPDNGYGPLAVSQGYNFPVQHGYDGLGRATGVAISGDFQESDLALYLANFGITRRGPATTRVQVDGGAPFVLNTGTQGAASLEATLDVETLVGNAPGTALYMYLFPDLSTPHILDGYNQAVSDGIVDVVNSSFGGCETDDPSLANGADAIAIQGAAKGITFTAASGDQGSTGCGSNFQTKGVTSPAVAPHFVAVGGTNLQVNPLTGDYVAEVAWNATSSAGGSGGGVSVMFPLPSYQTGVPNIVATGRNMPDVSSVADTTSGGSLCFGGLWAGPIGGTSWSTPQWSALITEINAYRHTRSGFVNPRLYAAYLSYGYAPFHDITVGTNGFYVAQSGYDQVTGIGSANGWVLAALL